VNAEGDFVVAEPDKAAWEKFQAKAMPLPSASHPIHFNSPHHHRLEMLTAQRAR
jgi:hypothetical protein